jgi:hypothetical protein
MVVIEGLYWRESLKKSNLGVVEGILRRILKDVREEGSR